jgi:hypothetical protein
MSKTVRQPTAPDANKTVPPKLSKVAVTGPGSTVGLATGTGDTYVEAKPTGKGASK